MIASENILQEMNHVLHLASRPDYFSTLLTDPALARRILANTRELLKVAFSAEHECEDPLRLGKALLEENGLIADRASLKPPMLLLEAVEKECEEASVDVAKKIRATGRLAEAYFGNVPVASLMLISAQN